MAETENWERVGTQRAEQAARDVTNMLNSGFGMFGRAFIAQMSREHRTLQQMFTGLCLLWFKHLSELNEHQYDLRNEYSVKLAKQIRRQLEAEHGLYWTAVPHI